eukprot:470802-Hanusia_phi.AAC.1
MFSRDLKVIPLSRLEEFGDIISGKTEIGLWAESDRTGHDNCPRTHPVAMIIGPRAVIRLGPGP